MHWIMMLLVIGGSYSNPAVTSTEFVTQQACEEAAVTVWTKWKHQSASVFPVCVAKGGE